MQSWVVARRRIEDLTEMCWIDLLLYLFLGYLQKGLIVYLHQLLKCCSMHKSKRVCRLLQYEVV